MAQYSNRCFCFAGYFMKQQEVLTTINKAIVINKKNKMEKLVQVLFAGAVFLEVAFVKSIILSQIITV